MAKRYRELRVAYLFPDGHAKLVYKVEEPMAPMGYIEVVEVVEKFCKSRFRGRIIIHDTGLLAAIKDATMVTAKTPAVENGSENSKAKGISMGYLSVNNKFGHFAVYHIDGVIRGGYSFQPEEKWEEEFSNTTVGNLWCDMKITKIIAAKKEKV